jgi:hypothetical protein
VPCGHTPKNGFKIPKFRFHEDQPRRPGALLHSTATERVPAASLTMYACTDKASSCLADNDPRTQVAGCAAVAAMSSRHKFYRRVATGLFKCATIYRSMSTHVIALLIPRMLASQEIGTLQFDSSSDSFGRKVCTKKELGQFLHLLFTGVEFSSKNVSLSALVLLMLLEGISQAQQLCKHMWRLLRVCWQIQNCATCVFLYGCVWTRKFGINIDVECRRFK